jgi:DNA-binding SARP family transcriptional activator
MVEVALLGTFEVRLDGRPVSLRPKQRALLAVLALRARETVSVDRLVDDLWGERPPATATASLQNAVSLARRALGDGVLVTRDGGYALTVDPEQIDASRFEELLAEAQSARGEERAAVLRRALALWRGTALGDLAFEPFAAVEAPRLDELRLSAREQLAEVELALGRHESVLGELEALVESSPYRERPRALLMLALYRSGRQAEALEAFQATRRVLGEELGLEPSPALRALQAAMLRQDPALDPPEAAALPHFVGEERRKTVTVVFCDLVESTALAASLDPEAYRAVLRRYYRASRDVLERHGGTVEKFVGDAVLAVFGVPESHEDDALRAVRAVVELRRSIAELNSELEQAHGVVLRTRMGVNTGEAIAGEPETGQSFATGYAVNVAAKLQQAAPADGILLGAPTFRLIRDAVAAEAVEPLAIGGAAAPIPAFLVADIDPDAPGVARNLGAPLVGRGDELAALVGDFDAAKDARTCQVATVVGDAGIGKSRLAAELSTLLEDEATVLIGRCVSYGEGATYLPVAEVVRRLVPDGSEAGIAALLPDDADARVVARRVRELLGWAEGVPPPGEGFWAVRRLLEAVARARPLLLVLEDVHWAEPTLLDLVDHLAEQATDAPMLVLCLARPDLLESRPSSETRVLTRLAPLSDEESAELLDNLASVPTETRSRIVATGEGNALFVEQLHAYAVEAGHEALSAVPPTVDALLASRLDRLPEAERAVLERAAVVGREFWRGAVDELSERSARAELEALALRGLVRPARSVLAGEDALAFHHVLIRDVAYAGITKERRSKLHEHVASWLDEREPGWDELVGYHLEQAHRLRVDLAPADDEARTLALAAGGRLGSAGVRALKREDGTAAINLLGRAAGLLEQTELRAELLCELGVAHRMSGDGDVAATVLRAALECAQSAHSERGERRARIELAHAGLYRVGGLRATAEEVLDTIAEALPMLEEFADDRALARAWLAVADAHSFELQIKAWGESAREALTYYRRSGFSSSVCLGIQAASLYYGPTPAPSAIRACRQLLDEVGDDLLGEATATMFLAGLQAMRREFESARDLADQARAIYEDRRGHLVLAGTWATVAGEIARLEGDLPRAEGVLRDGCDALAGLKQYASLATKAALLADLLADTGDLIEAERYARISERHSDHSDLLSQSLWRGALAKVLAARGSPEAGAFARDAIAIVADSDAVNARARAWLTLAQVLQTTGAGDESARSAREAHSLFRRKGNLAEAAHARALTEESVRG